MIHQGKVQRGLLVSMLLLVNLPPLLLWSFPTGFALYFQLFISVLIVLALFIKVRVRVRKDNILYRIELWSLPLYSASVYANEVRRIDFKRSNWTSKMAIARMKKGIDLRFALFPKELFADLTKFSEQNSIELRKSKDYKALEKLDSNQIQ